MQLNELKGKYTVVLDGSEKEKYFGRRRRRGQGGAEGDNSLAKMSKNTFLTKKCANFFSAQNLAREAYSGHSGDSSAPPLKRSAPSKKNSWLRMGHLH